MSTAAIIPATTEELFNAAVEVIRELPKNGSYQPSNQLMLRFYGFYKQATEGPCKIGKPAFWDVIGRAKWEAWNKLGDMPRVEAMKEYVEELKKIIETIPYTGNIDKFMDILGPFFEVLDLPVPEALQNGHDIDPDSEIAKRAAKVAARVASRSTANGEATVNGDVEENDRHMVRISKDSLKDKQFTDSDSENEEYGDPIEAQLEDIKILKKSMIDHNDNDSGFSDQVGYSHFLIDDPQHQQMWAAYANGGGDSMILQETPQISNGLHDFSETKEVLMAMKSKGLMARGGGEENGANGDGGGPISQRRAQGFSADGRGQRDNLNETNMGLASRRAGVGGSGRGGGRGGSISQQPNDISEQIAMALLRLQRDMDSVLARLNVLETVALAQHNTAQDRLIAQLNVQSQKQLTNKSTKPSWWPFKDLSMRTFLFFLSWPVILHVVIKVLASRRARRHLRNC